MECTFRPFGHFAEATLSRTRAPSLLPGLSAGICLTTLVSCPRHTHTHTHIHAHAHPHISPNLTVTTSRPITGNCKVWTTWHRSYRSLRAPRTMKRRGRRKRREQTGRRRSSRIPCTLIPTRVSTHAAHLPPKHTHPHLHAHPHNPHTHTRNRAAYTPKKATTRFGPRGNTAVGH